MDGIGILVIKCYKRFKSIIVKNIWKICYGRHFSCDKMTFFYPGTHVTVEKDGYLHIGKHCFFNHNCSITCLKKIYIGNDCIFGENVKLYDHNHNHLKNDLPFRKQGYEKKEIRIGNNCWIGSNVIILAGVEIGDNVIIGAGSVVTKSIPSETIFIQKQKNYQQILRNE